MPKGKKIKNKREANSQHLKKPINHDLLDDPYATVEPSRFRAGIAEAPGQKAAVVGLKEA